MLLGERCFLLAPETKEILVLAAYTALLGYVLCGFGHRIDAVRISHGRIDEPPTKSCVLNLLGTIEGACSFPQHIGRSAHTLDAASNHQVGISTTYRTCSQSHRIETGAAEPVHRATAHSIGQPREQRRHPGNIAVIFACLVCAPENDIINALQIDIAVAFHK